jgi:hypothetical protein
MHHLITTLLFTLLSAPTLALTPYTAIYNATISGLSASNHITLSPVDSSGQIELLSVSKARGLAKLLKNDPIVEYTRFKEVNGEYHPIEYHYLFNNDSSKRDAWIIFDQEKLIAKSLYKTEIIELDIQPAHVDRMLEQLIFRTDLMAGSVADKYLTVERNSLRESIYKKLGSEIIKTEAGSFHTVKYSRQRVGSLRRLIIWFAPELEYLPVRMQHFKEKKITGSITLKYYAIEKND